MEEDSMLLVAQCLCAGRVVAPKWTYSRMAKLAMSILIECTIPGTIIHMEAKMALLLAGDWYPPAIRATLANRRREWKAQGRL